MNSGVTVVGIILMLAGMALLGVTSAKVYNLAIGNESIAVQPYMSQSLRAEISAVDNRGKVVVGMMGLAGAGLLAGGFVAYRRGTRIDDRPARAHQLREAVRAQRPPWQIEAIQRAHETGGSQAAGALLETWRQAGL